MNNINVLFKFNKIQSDFKGEGKMSAKAAQIRNHQIWKKRRDCSQLSIIMHNNKDILLPEEFDQLDNIYNKIKKHCDDRKYTINVCNKCKSLITGRKYNKHKEEVNINLDSPFCEICNFFVYELTTIRKDYIRKQ